MYPVITFCCVIVPNRETNKANLRLFHHKNVNWNPIFMNSVSFCIFFIKKFNFWLVNKYITNIKKNISQLTRFDESLNFRMRWFSSMISISVKKSEYKAFAKVKKSNKIYPRHLSPNGFFGGSSSARMIQARMKVDLSILNQIFFQVSSSPFELSLFVCFAKG